MIYFCADDYGISKETNRRIEECVEKGTLNKVSVLPNGDIDGFVQRFAHKDVLLTLHLNLVEGRPLSPTSEVDLLVDENGCFKYSFIGLFKMSFSPKRKQFKKQLYTEIQNQLRFWVDKTGNKCISVDCHQHVYEIPMIFSTLMKVIRDEELDVKYLRIPAEPLRAYLLTPSLYHTYSVTGLIKQWLLKSLAFVNRRYLKGMKFTSAYFMGVMFSGKLEPEKVQRLLKHYSYLSEKNERSIEVAFHPGYAGDDMELMADSRSGFDHFYSSPWRNVEYKTLMSDEFYEIVKEGNKNAIS